ncbi:MAG: immunoglobulin domain-containing protein [Limisphaerales bacterium]
MRRQSLSLSWLWVWLWLCVGLSLVLVGARANTITWTGAGDGRSWNQAANWDAKAVPHRTNDVVIPEKFTQVEHLAGFTEVRRVTASGGLVLRGGTLKLTEGESRFGGRVRVEEGATLEADGPKAVVLVEGAPTEFGGNVWASDGAMIHLKAVTQVRGDSPDWRANGRGSLVDAASVTNLALGTRAWFPISARNEGRINLSGVETLRGPLRITATDGGIIDLSGARGRWAATGFSYGGAMDVKAGGSVLLGGLTSLDRVDVNLDRTGVLPMARWLAFTGGTLDLEGVEVALDALTNFEGSSLTLSDGAVLRMPELSEVRGESMNWKATGVGTVLDARSVKTLALGTRGWFPIGAENEARIDLSGLTVLRGAIRPSANHGGVIDLSNVRGLWTSEGFAYQGAVEAKGGGKVLLPGLTDVDRIEVTLDRTGELPAAQWVSFTQGTLTLDGAELVLKSLTTIDDAKLRLEGGAVLRFPGVSQVRGESLDWRAEGFETLLDASSVKTIALGTRAWFPIVAANEARVDLSGLGELRGPIRPNATDRGVIDLRGVTGRWTTEGFSYDAEISATGGGRVLLPGLTGLDRVNVVLDRTGELPMAQWTSFLRGQLNLDGPEVVLDAVTDIDDAVFKIEGGAVLRLPKVTQLRGDTPNWLAEGFGSLIDAKAVTSLLLGPRAWFPIEARNAARIDLSGVLGVTGPVRLKAVTGGVIDLSGARGLWTTEGFSYTGSLEVASEGRIQVGGISAMDRLSIGIDGSGRIDTDRLESLRRSDVTVDGFDAVLAVGNLKDQTGTTFRIVNGGQVLFASAPRIVVGPESKRLRLGESWTLRTSAEGDEPLSYQWFLNGQPLPGQVSASLLLDAVGPKDAGAYTVLVRNPAGLIESDPALVTLDVTVWPFGDTFAERGRIGARSGIGIGSNEGGTMDFGEPSHASKVGGKSVWLSWRAPESGVAMFETVGSNFDTLLAVYRGTTVATLGSNRVAADDDDGGFFTSRVQFNAEAGVDYEIVVDGFAGAAGDVILGWTLDPAVPPLPVITQQPIDVLAVEGSSASFSVRAGPDGVAYQWFRKGVALAGQTGSVLAIASVTPADAGDYFVEIRTPGGAQLRSDLATLEVADQVRESLGLSADKIDELYAAEDAGGAARSLMFRGRTGAGGGLGIGLPGGQWTDNSRSTRSVGDPLVCDVATSATRWFLLRLRVPAVNALELHTEGSEIPALLAVFTNRTALTLVGCDAAALPGKPTAKVTFPARSGVDYLVLVDGVDGAQGRIKLNWVLEEEAPPVRPPELSFDAGRLVILMHPLPGQYDWLMGDALDTMRTMFRTNLSAGEFRFADPDPATAPSRFFQLKPVRE